jgi:pimeloyl-ACP methyl ester carboxylesterase
MVAQEVAIRHPERVGALVLGATTPGGLLAAPPPPAVQGYFVRHRGMPADEAIWASVPHTYAASTQLDHPERIAEDVARRLRDPVDPAVYAAQVAVAMKHDARARLGRIAAPTLILHGEDDAVVPVVNARTLATRIPEAELLLLSGAGHMYMTDVPDADRQVARFLKRHGSALVRERGLPRAA